MSSSLIFRRPTASLRYLALISLLACAGGVTEPTTYPLPALLSVSPSLIVMGTDVGSLTLSGSGFTTTSQARWGGRDRVTHYVNAQTLTVDLLPVDVAGVGTTEVSTMNGAPGGGTSGSVAVSVVYPAPQLTSVSPNTMPIQTTPFSNTPVTITGTGFGSQSVLRLGGAVIASTFVSPTQITTNLSNDFLRKLGTLKFSVANPTPGGGTSNVLDLSVVYQVPSISLTTPDSALIGAGGFTLTVNGSGFGSSSVVRWNGTDRSTTFVSTTKLTAAISGTDVASGASVSLSVFNPAPGGGSSNTVPFVVREGSPIIGSISPAVITAGSAATAITISGTNFRSGATAQWNGQDRTTTLVSATSLTITLTGGDLASPGIGKVTVVNPGASGVSNGMALVTLARGASLAVARTIALTHTDLVYDSTRAVLYASVPSSAGASANSIVRIDPASGAITGTLAVGSNPATLAIADDGSFLYVALLGAPKIVRVDLITFTKDIEIALPGAAFLGSNSFAEDIVPIPGLLRTIAASTFYTGQIPRNAGALVFDDSLRRAPVYSAQTGINRITRGPSGARVYGYNNETTEFGFRSVLVSADGLREETVKSGLVSGFGTDIEYSGGFVYASTGDVVDVAAMQKLGTIAASGVVRPDAANARVHFLSDTTIRTFHYRTFGAIGAFSDPALASHTKLIRWGNDGLAAGGGTSIVLLRGALAGQ